jgi:hypothetical protein
MSALELWAVALRHRLSARIARRCGLADWAADHMRLYRRAMGRRQLAGPEKGRTR